jgi:hypothetical protein
MIDPTIELEKTESDTPSESSPWHDPETVATIPVLDGGRKYTIAISTSFDIELERALFENADLEKFYILSPLNCRMGSETISFWIVSEVNIKEAKEAKTKCTILDVVSGEISAGIKSFVLECDSIPKINFKYPIVFKLAGAPLINLEHIRNDKSIIANFQGRGKTPLIEHSLVIEEHLAIERDFNELHDPTHAELPIRTLLESGSQRPRGLFRYFLGMGVQTANDEILYRIIAMLFFSKQQPSVKVVEEADKQDQARIGCFIGERFFFPEHTQSFLSELGIDMVYDSPISEDITKALDIYREHYLNPIKPIGINDIAEVSHE